MSTCRAPLCLPDVEESVECHPRGRFWERCISIHDGCVYMHCSGSVAYCLRALHTKTSPTGHFFSSESTVFELLLPPSRIKDEALERNKGERQPPAGRLWVFDRFEYVYRGRWFFPSLLFL